MGNVQINNYTYSHHELKDWGNKVLLKCGLNEEECEYILDVLIHSNLRGVDTHGIIRIIDYANRLIKSPRSKIDIVNETQTLTVIDGKNNPGPICASYAMKIAIKKARHFGCGVSSVRGSNHFSTAAYYSLLAVEQEMVGITMSSSSPRIAPWGGLDAVIGNNPWSIAVPGYDFPIVLDMANTIVAMGKIRTCMREGKPLEPGWAMDSQGNPTTDATEAFNGLLVPIGNYKGVGISIMVDLLSSAISQSIAFSNEVKRVEDSEHPQNVSHIFIAFNISDMVDITLFKESMAKYTQTIKSVRRKEGCNEIFMPGEIEWRTECDRRKSGIVLSDKAVSQLNNFATQLGVSPLPIV